MSIGDIGAGLYTAVAVNAALVHRTKTGESTKVDIAMFDCQLALLENAIMRYTVEGEIPGPLGARHPTITPFQAFKTADGAIIIAAGNDSLFVKMCGALGLESLAVSPDYKSNALRQKHHKQLELAIESVLKGQSTAHWIEVVSKAGVPCGPINNIEQAIAHPQVAARNMLVEVPDGSGGTLKLAGNPLKMSAFADPTTRRAAPDLDADRAAILSYIGG
jgi:CoA:oxalate CoA-transferase